jgi:hypothetical protein
MGLLFLQNTNTCDGANRPDPTSTFAGGNATIRPTRGIQPVHVREAMRRYLNQAGVLTPHAVSYENIVI